MRSTPSTMLTRTLAVNAGSSAATGIALVAGASPLSDWLGIPLGVSVAVGAGLLVFAAGVTRVARKPQGHDVRLVIALDVAWVIGAAVVILGFPAAMSTAGLWALGIISLAVAEFAILQALGMRRFELAA